MERVERVRMAWTSQSVSRATTGRNPGHCKDVVVLEHFIGCDLVMIKSNHSLVIGVWAWRRILNPRGLERILQAQRGKCKEDTSHTIREPSFFSNPGKGVSKQNQQNNEQEIKSGNSRHW